MDVLFCVLNPLLHVLMFDFTKLIIIEVNLLWFCQCLELKLLRITQNNSIVVGLGFLYSIVKFKLFKGSKEKE